MISIIIPIYNAEKDLERMLRGIQNQTFSDYEVIMIDDGSKDQSADICKSFTSMDERFRYYYQRNQGVSMARNHGLEKVSGEYIAFLDADDEIDQNYFEELLKKCQNADIAVCDVVVECEGKETTRFTGKDSILSKSEAINLLLSRRIINSGPCAKLFKRKIVDMHKFPVMKTYEDILFNMHVFSEAETVAVTSETQYHYITNPKGAMSSMHKAPSLDIIEASDQIMQFIRNNKELDSECLYITVSHLFQYVLEAIQTKEDDRNLMFFVNTCKFYKKYLFDILKCEAIPTKEKIVFAVFITGWVYHNKQWTYYK